MNFENNTILKLFSVPNKSYQIPVYQRAYSWDIDNWKVLYEDILEQIKGHNNYYFGNILLETISKHKLYDIIDGQQRLTTITIVLRALFDILKERIDANEIIEIDIPEKMKTYFINGSTYKFVPIGYDKSCYDTLIVKGNNKFPVASPSQERILGCKQFFASHFSKLPTSVLLEILEKIEDSEITTIELTGKKDSALMFELQNNRGKDLTNMEKLKSYLMYQMYVYSKPDEIESNISFIANFFKDIYILIYDIKKIDEDSILLYHCYAYINGFNYRNLDEIKEILKSSNNQVNWINEFVMELHNTFSNIKKLELNNSFYLKKIRQFDIPNYIYPFLIKGYKYFGDDEKKLNSLCQILEVLVFRQKLIGSSASILTRLNSPLNSFEGNLNDLLTSLNEKVNAENHWSDSRVKARLNGYMYENPVLHYLLWEYENSIQKNGYVISNVVIVDEEIEHISPKKERDLDKIELGYDIDDNGEYSEEFVENYLNKLGNLMLISKSHNCSIGNIPFSQKLDSYNQTPFLKQQAEIKDFIELVENKPCWFKYSIDKRHSEILKFCIDRWSFNTIII